MPANDVPGDQTRRADPDVGGPSDGPVISAGTAVVTVLGPIAVGIPSAGTSIEVGGRRARIALAALGMAGRPLAADYLAEIVWAGSPPPTWPAALRNVITSLRAALEPIGRGEQRLVVTLPTGYALVNATTDLAEAIGRPVDHLVTVQGASLPDELDHPFFQPYRAQLENLRRVAAEQAITAATTDGDHRTAVQLAHRLADDGPLDEAAHRLLFAALQRAGDRPAIVAGFARLRTALADQLGVDPSPQTVQAYLAGISDETARMPRARLPSPRGRFVGRGLDLSMVGRRLSQPGLVTLTGRGGIGKSRLAVELARTARREGVTVLYVALAEVPDDELVASHVAVGLGAVGSDPVSAVADALAPLGAVVLVLDGCDVVPDGVAAVAGVLMHRCPQLTVLATSRAPLTLAGEHVHTLRPLAEGVELLAEHLGLERPRFDSPAPPDRAALSALAARCAGIPLAIELVAAQLNDFSAADLLDRLPAGEQTLTALLAYGYATLSDDEAAVFRRIAVLAGPAGLGLVTAVATRAVSPAGGAPFVRPARVARILRELSSRGLVQLDRDSARWGYQLDDDIRRFAAERLAEAGEEADVLDGLFVSIRELLPDDPTAAPSSFSAEITAILGSVRSLLDAAVQDRTNRDHGLEIAFRLHRYFAATSVTEGRFWLDRLLARVLRADLVPGGSPDDDFAVEGATASPPGPWAGRSAFANGYLAYWAGDVNAARPLLSAAVELLTGASGRTDDGADQARDAIFAVRALVFLGGISDDLDDGQLAVQQMRRAIDLAAPTRDFGVRLGAFMGIAAVLGERGNPEALRFARRAIAMARSPDAPAHHLPMVLATGSTICWQIGDVSALREMVAEAAELLGDEKRISHVIVLTAQAVLALLDDDPSAAQQLASRAAVEADKLGLERELPLTHAVHAVAARDAGAATGDGGWHRRAGDAAAAALKATQALTYRYPLAVALEAAALVADAPASAVADLLKTAQHIRAAGDRPAPPWLAARLDALAPTNGSVLPAAQAIQLAHAVLAAGQPARGSSRN